MKRNIPYLISAITIGVGGWLLASIANDLAELSLRAYGTGSQTIIGGPAIWLATFRQIKQLFLLVPAVIVVARQVRWLNDLSCALFLGTWAFFAVTWTFSVAYFSMQPGILG